MDNLIEDEKEGKRHRDDTQRSETDNPHSEGGHRRHKDDEDSEIEYVDENGKRRRAKRRSKNDLDGRDYKCSFCPKTYLSYPALYTHMKTKHSKGSDGQHLLLNSGRGRGRPKKNAGRVTTIDPESDDYFKTLDKGGGPTDPLFYFDKIIMDFFSDESYVNRKREENKSQNRIDNLESKNEDNKDTDMPPPLPIAEEGKEIGKNTKHEDDDKSKENEVEQDKQSIPIEVKEESEEAKSDSQ